MKRLLYFILVLFAVLALMNSCKEESLEPNVPEENIFLEPYGITGEQLTLQKDFFNETKSYLLFNDTLDRKYLGLDAEGNELYKYVMLDLTYAMISSTSDVFEFEYMATLEEKQTAANFIKEKLLPSLSENLRPYSFLLVNKIAQYELSLGDYYLTNPSVYAGWRSTAVALEGVNNMPEEEQAALKKQLLKTILQNSISKVDQSVFDEFYAVSSKYYSKYSVYNVLNDFPEIAYSEDVRDTGLLYAYLYHNVNSTTFVGGFMNFPSASIDLGRYIDLLFDKTQAEVEQENADFPLVIKKYKLLKAIVEEIGIII